MNDNNPKDFSLGKHIMNALFICMQNPLKALKLQHINDTENNSSYNSNNSTMSNKKTSNEIARLVNNFYYIY